LEGSIAVAGIGYNWLQNNLKAVSHVNELGKLFLCCILLADIKFTSLNEGIELKGIK
jgi:hypothetical protein